MTARITHKRYGASEIHHALSEKVGQREDQRDRVYETAHQALFCPYYVNLEGRLGGDWGVIVNPESPFFGTLVFEHDWCGCPGDPPENHRGDWQSVENAWEDRRKSRAQINAFLHKHRDPFGARRE